MDNQHNSHHGVIVYIHKDIPVQCMHKISNCDMETIKLLTFYNDNILTIIGLYIQPQVPESRIQTFMRTILLVSQIKIYVIALGDFNMNVNELIESYNIS